MNRKRPPQVGSVIAAGLHMTIVCDAFGRHTRKTLDVEALWRELDENYFAGGVIPLPGTMR